MVKIEENFKKLYDFLLETRELKIRYKGLSGIWEEDREKFIKYQTELETLANIIDEE